MAFGDRFRYVIAAAIFTSTLSVYVGRINLSTAIVEMAVENRGDSSKKVIFLDVCNTTDLEASSSSSSSFLSNQTFKDLQSSERAQKFDWNEKTQGLILGAFFWGYFLLQVPGGRMAERFGPRLLATTGVIGTGMINLITPLAAPHYVVFLLSRVVLGGLQAMVFPSAFQLTTRWIPEEERSTVISLTSCGGAIGIIITSALSGYLAKQGFAGGWPSVFYVSGIICISVGVLYFLLVRNDPKEHPFVSQTEYEYIVEHITALREKRDQDKLNRENKMEILKPKPPPFPWIKVLTSPPIIGQVCVKITLTWAYSLVILKAPAYMEKVLRMPLEMNGYFTSAAFVSFGLSHLLGGIAADFVLKRQWFASKTQVRKIFEGLATFGTSAFLFLIPLVGCDRTLFLVLLIASQATFGMQAGGELPLPSDMSHEFTATLFAIANMFGMSTGFVGPYLAGIILDMDPSRPRRQWSYIIYFTAAFNVFGGIIFTLLASADPQNWGKEVVKGVEEKNDEKTNDQKNKIAMIGDIDYNGNHLSKRESF